MFQVFIGFIPWIIYWSFSGPGLWTIAILGGLIAAAGLVSWRWIQAHAMSKQWKSSHWDISQFMRLSHWCSAHHFSKPTDRLSTVSCWQEWLSAHWQ